MTPEIARERVTRGATLLDEKLPGWFERVDLGTLRIGSCADCVLGQLGGARKFAFVEMCERFFPNNLDLAIECGFGRTDDDDNYLIWVYLGQAWKDAILERRSMPPVVTWTPCQREVTA